jgi:hypothetical protein
MGALEEDLAGFGCRRCHELTYTSCQESHKFDRLYGRIAREFGKGFSRVNWKMERIGKH